MRNMPPSVGPIKAAESEFHSVIDIRPHAASTPTIPNSVAVPAEQLLTDPSLFIKPDDGAVLIVCDIGLRSAVVTTQLRSSGFLSVTSLEGGISAWVAEGLEIEMPKGLSPEEYQRYDRQLKLPDFGIAGQQALRDARVAIVGVGGLGSPVLGYLAAAGIGHLTIIDADRVEVSNLHRQPIYTTGDVGKPKSETAAAYARALNPTIEVSSFATLLDASNAQDLLRDHDLVVTCTDSFETTQAINTAAVVLGIPMVFGSVYRTEGQLAVFDSRSGPCYTCAFPMGTGVTGLDCSIVGVLGPVTGVIGSMQSVETINILIGSSEVDTTRLVMYDALSQSVESVTLRKRPTCAACGTEPLRSAGD
jgi:molybdopterin/thiamine biosynthesis adenylyltransferase/rhodanese-related sulfurtransferase